ncbi:threonine/serine ThrE exporter family protein [Romboutsia lituseburensis]|uniref:threonine/serine ThrE exporter family protein n=1 Tax=Romboutsia lituseburensis TaxID=1537 RepID=UPI00215A8C06|nr:threonine/serine exporter family protein [Romboutsia lituseburensis]MCR8747014.1 threonine/serine exporter family protein [Romboutsia lituseburensis]
MEEKHNHKYKKDVLRLATFIGQLMLTNGAETFRVDDTVKRICKSRGFYHINVFMAPNTIIVSDDRFDGYTFMKVIENRCINLNKIDLLNDFSRKFVSEIDMSIDDAIEELKNLEEKPPHSQIAINIWTAIGSSSFAVLVGGDNLITFMLTLITSVMAMIIYDKVKQVSNIPVFATMVSSLIIGFCGVGLVELGILETPKMLIVGSIMPLLPGVPFIKAIRDLVSGELMSGVGRAIDAGIIATGIAVGVGMAMNIYVKWGGML